MFGTVRIATQDPQHSPQTSQSFAGRAPRRDSLQVRNCRNPAMNKVTATGRRARKTFVSHAPQRHGKPLRPNRMIPGEAVRRFDLPEVLRTLKFGQVTRARFRSAFLLSVKA